MRKVRWTFGDEKSYEGYTDGTRWNGFMNVWVTPETHAEVLGDFTGEELEESGLNTIEPEPSGLYSYANGFATQEDSQ